MKKTMTRLLLLVFISMSTVLAIGQQRKVITGTVRDTSGNALPAITFSVKGTKISGATDGQGFYRVAIPGSTAVLEFTGVGYEKATINVGGGSDVSNVTLATSANAMNEVVVTGFGMKKQTRKLAYSISEIKGDDITRASSPNIMNALQGKVAGVFVGSGNGGPMSSSRIRIRGNASLSSNTQPLVVIDGVIMEQGTTGGDSWGDAQDFGNQIKNLNPDDYESVTVLKGSAASALYGSQAQNGVLLISTKKGKAQKGLGVKATHTETFDYVYKTLAVQNEFGAGINPTFTKGTDGIDVVDAPNFSWSFGPRFNGQQVRDIDGRLINWNAQPNNLKDAFQTGRFVNTGVSVEGGGDKGTFRASYTNLYNSYITDNSDLKRNNFAVRATQKISNFLNIDASINYSVTKSKNPLAQGSTNNPIFSLVYFNPRNYDTKYWMDNYLDSAGGLNRNNPYGLAGLWFNLYKRDNVQTEKTLLANIDVTANITSWLNLLVRANVNDANVSREGKSWGTGLKYAGGSYSIHTSTRRNTRLQFLLNAERKLSDNLDLSITAGGETQRYEPEKFTTANTEGGLKAPGRFYLDNSVSPVTTRGGIANASSKRIDGIYAFGDLTYKNMLTLNFSARNDWNSTLMYPRDGHGEPSYFYPGVGLSWIFTEVLKSPSFNFLSFGKLRASYAHTGYGVEPWNTSVGNYRFLSAYNTGPTTQISRYGFDGNTLGNQNMRSKLTKELELGLDVRFLQNRIGLDIAVYKKNSYNELIELGLPPESGATAQFVNAGNIENKGIEVLLNFVPVKTRDWNWDVTFNFSKNKNKIIELAPGVASKDLDLAFGADMASVARAGRDYGTIITNYAYATFQAKNAAGANVAHANNGQKVLKQNGSYYRASELGQPAKELGTMMEKFLLNHIQNVRYKNVSLGVQLDSKIGGLMASATHQYGSTNGSLASTLFGRDAATGGLVRKTYDPATGAVTGTFNDGIIPEGVFGNGISIKAPNGTTYDVSGMSYKEAADKGIVEPVSARIYYARLTQWSTGIREYSTFENSWVAVREVSIGYTMPTKLSSKLKLQSLRVSIIGRNLGYLYTTTKDDIFPEGGILSNRAGTFAEYGGLPYVRSLGFKVDAGF